MPKKLVSRQWSPLRVKAPCSRLKCSRCSGMEHTSRALRKVVHFFCNVRAPPMSSCVQRGLFQGCMAFTHYVQGFSALAHYPAVGSDACPPLKAGWKSQPHKNRRASRRSQLEKSSGQRRRSKWVAPSL